MSWSVAAPTLNTKERGHDHAGAPIEFVRHAATHSDVSQTADYDRGQAEATAKVMKMRMESRNKPKT